MNVKDLPPESIIDRDVQKEIFARILQIEDDARLLVISDKADTGKSTLLRFFEYSSSYIHNVLVGLVALDEETSYNDDFTLVKGIRERLRPQSFDIFDSLETARVNFHFEPFTRNMSRTTIATVTASAISGGTVGGTVNVYQPQVQNVKELVLPPLPPPSTAWPNSEMEGLARQKCIEAFLQEFKILCSVQPVVLLFDSWDKHRGNARVKEWILRYIIQPYCFDLRNRPTKLIIVIAGQRVPDFSGMLKEKYPTLVKIPGPSSWKKNHVRDFLKLHGYGSLTEEDFDIVFQTVQRGMPIGSALKFANVFKDSYDQ